MTFYKISDLKAKIARAAATVMLLLAAGSTYAAEYFQRLAMEGVELMGAITWGKVDEFTVMQRGFYEFPYDSKFAPNKTQSIHLADALGGCVYHDGKIYANEFGSHSQDVKPMWRIYDAKTFALLSEHELPDNCAATTTSLTYDQTSDNIYGFNETYTETYVVRVDPNTGEMTRLGDYLDRNYKFFAMACSPSGDIYCTYLNKNTDVVYLGKVRKSTGQVAMIRPISASNLMGSDAFINSALDQAMFYNNATGKLYWMFQSSSELLYKDYTPIFEINPLTADAVMVAYLEDAFLTTGMFFVEPDMKAPAVAQSFDWTADGEGTEEGTISVQLPTTAYDGSTLQGDLTLTITADELEPITVSKKPGETFAKHIELPSGWNTLNITVSNAAGDGPTMKRRVFSGFDIPKAPTNIVLVNNDLHTILAWDAPTEGINGIAISPEKLSYNVVRYPGEVTVAEDLTERRFEEDHPEEMTRYVYKVTTKMNGRPGRSAYSNNLIIGKPLNTPYGGGFEQAEDLYNYYTILDSNGDNYTWAYAQNTQNAVYQYNMAEPADDWLISPAINYEKGKTYELSFMAYSSSLSYREALQVTFGADKTPEAQDNILLDLPELPAHNEEGGQQVYRLQFTVPTDGVYYFGFHAVSEKFREYLYVDKVKVEEYDPTAIADIANTNDVEVSTVEGALCVRLAKTAEVTVRDFSGQTVATASGTDLRMPLRPGAYIVSAVGKTVKAVVK